MVKTATAHCTLHLVPGPEGRPTHTITQGDRKQPGDPEPRKPRSNKHLTPPAAGKSRYVRARRLHEDLHAGAWAQDQVQGHHLLQSQSSLESAAGG